MMETSRQQENAAKYQELSKENALPGPISLSVDISKPLQLPPLEWQNWKNSGQLKITNNGYTTVITGHWRGNRPSVFGGPFTAPFTLAQIHFHWGSHANQGSEHAFEDKRYPLEMHVLLFKSVYERSKVALKERDGLAVLAYVFQITEKPNANLDPILDGLSSVREPKKQAPISPASTDIVEHFTNEYFLYWAGVRTDHCSHMLSWIVNPNPQNISTSQLELFRKILGPDQKPIVRNFCELQPHMGRQIFYVTDTEGEPVFIPSVTRVPKCGTKRKFAEGSSFRTSSIIACVMGAKNTFRQLTVNLNPADTGPITPSDVTQSKVFLDVFPRSQNEEVYCCLSAREKKLTENISKIIEDLRASMDLTRERILELEGLTDEITLQNQQWYRLIDQRMRCMNGNQDQKSSNGGRGKEPETTKRKVKRALVRRSSSVPSIPVTRSRRTAYKRQR